MFPKSGHLHNMVTTRTLEQKTSKSAQVQEDWEISSNVAIYISYGTFDYFRTTYSSEVTHWGFSQGFVNKIKIKYENVN